MRIFKANLVLRFNTSDGWNRQLVSNLLKEPDYSKVIPRYYDMEKDQHIMSQLEKDFTMPESLNEGEWLDCDYFAIYDKCKEFEPMLMENHEIIIPDYYA